MVTSIAYLYIYIFCLKMFKDPADDPQTTRQNNSRP